MAANKKKPIDPLLTAEPGDPSFAVWGDALTEQGDPRGELVTLSRQLAQRPDDEKLKAALDALVIEHADAWCPGCADVEELALTWRDGFIDSITFSPPDLDGSLGYEGDEDEDEDEDEEGDAELEPGAALLRVLDHPTAARLSSLSVHCPLDAEGNHGCWGHHDAFTARLVARDRPWLRSLELDADALPTRHPPQLSFLRIGIMHDAEITVGNLAPLWKRAPRLERLIIAQTDQVNLGEVNAPRLKTLVLGNASSKNLAAIAKGKLPALETLIVRVRNAKDVAALLSSKATARVAHLGLITDPSDEGKTGAGDAVLGALVESKRLEQLVTLDLGGLDASDAGWEKLVSAAPRFKRLEALRLTTWDIDPSVAESDDWMEESIEHFGGARFQPQKQPIGKALEAALPVRWLRATIVSVEAKQRPELFYGFWHSDGFAEQRS